jgi:hypothetical protein
VNLASILRDSEGQIQWATVVLLLFAVAFVVIGVMRTVEFRGLGIPGGRLALFVSAHLLGCLVFSAAICLAAVDVTAAHRVWMNILFFSGLALLFPGQIYIAFLRRQRQPKS